MEPKDSLDHVANLQRIPTLAYFVEISQLIYLSSPQPPLLLVFIFIFISDVRVFFLLSWRGPLPRSFRDECRPLLLPTDPTLDRSYDVGASDESVELGDCALPARVWMLPSEAPLFPSRCRFRSDHGTPKHCVRLPSYPVSNTLRTSSKRLDMSVGREILAVVGGWVLQD